MPQRKKIPRLNLRIENKPVFALGLLLLSLFVAYRIHLLLRLSFAGSPSPTALVQSAALPTRIQIPQIKLDLAIYPTTINNNLWQIDDRGISYLFNSARPGQSGPIIMYGHNTNDRFGPLRWLKPGNQVVVTDAQAVSHTYEIVEILTVSPKTLAVLSAPEETLILYTCTGFLDRERLVVKARPI